MTDTLLTKRSSARSITSITTKVPPHSIEAEQSVLGGLMLDNRAWDQVVDCLLKYKF